MIRSEAGAPRVIAALTSHNRRTQTLAALQAFERCAHEAGVLPQAVLVDDGSTDGTAQAVAERFPWVSVRVGDGSLFWCRGMHLAVADAWAGEPDFVLWLNDDTTLDPGALRSLLDCHAKLQARKLLPAIVVGTTVAPDGRTRTYGGEVRASRWRPMRFRPASPGDEPVRCESMNGNVVLVSASAVRIAGNLDPAFEHAMGDTDYALRAHRRGVGVWAAPGVHGECHANSLAGTYCDVSLPLRRRWALMMSRKGLPWRSWLRMTRRHGGWLWPAHFVWPYLRLVLGSVAATRRREVIQ